MAREQSLHRAGNCMQTCDVLDATYKTCPDTDTDCIFDEELDCLTKKKQCDEFNPPCPAGQYQVRCPTTVFHLLHQTFYKCFSLPISVPERLVSGHLLSLNSL